MNKPLAVAARTFSKGATHPLKASPFDVFTVPLSRATLWERPIQRCRAFIAHTKYYIGKRAVFLLRCPEKREAFHRKVPRRVLYGRFASLSEGRSLFIEYTVLGCGDCSVSFGG